MLDQASGVLDHLTQASDPWLFQGCRLIKMKTPFGQISWIRISCCILHKFGADWIQNVRFAHMIDSPKVKAYTRPPVEEVFRAGINENALDVGPARRKTPRYV